MNEIYCEECKHCSHLIFHNRKSDDLCKLHFYFSDNNSNKFKIYRKCSSMNANNNCEDFEAKLIRKFYKYIKNYITTSNNI